MKTALSIALLFVYVNCYSQELQWRQIGNPLADGQGFPFTDNPTNMIEVGTGFVLVSSSAAGMLRYNPLVERWSTANEGLGEDTIIYLENSRAKDTAICVDNSGRMYVSGDDGMSWDYFMDLPVPGMFAEHAGNGVYLAWSRDGGVYRTFDAGGNWTQIYKRTGYDRQMIVDVVDSETYLVGTEENGIYRTDNAGTTWEHVYTITVRVQTFTIDEDENIYAGTKLGIALSTDQGKTWSKFRTPNNVVHEAFNIAVSDSGIFIPYNEKLYFTGDSGATWEYLDETNIPNVWDVLSTSSNRVFVRSRAYGIWQNISGIRIYRSSLFNIRSNLRLRSYSVGSYDDNIYLPGIRSMAGSTREYLFFNNLHLDINPDESYTDLVQSTDGVMFVCTDYNLIASNDSAKSFFLIKGKAGPRNNYQDVALHSPNHVLILAFDSLHYSTDMGNSWISSGIDWKLGGTSVYISGNRTPFFTTRHKEIYRSPDDGKSWEMVLEGDKDANLLIAMTTGPDGKIYCGTHTSTDDGLTWDEIPDINLPPIKKWYFDDAGITWVATEAGLFWKSDTSQYWNRSGQNGHIAAFHRMDDGWYVVSSYNRLYVSEGFKDPTPVEAAPEAMPTRITLGAYPNPFTYAISVTMSVTKRTPTDLAVYNTLGRRVATLASAEFNPGSFTLQWNGLSGEGYPFPPGSYYIRLTTPSGMKTVRVLKVR